MEFFELFDNFLLDGCIENAASLGVPDFSPQTLTHAGYSVIGDTDDIHAYENYVDIFHKGKPLWIFHKQYFNKTTAMGNGFEIEPCARLITLIKRIPPQRKLRFYFDEFFHSGAMTIDDYYVVKFCTDCSRGAYRIDILESSLDKSGTLDRLAIRVVTSTLSEYQVGSPVSKKLAPNAYKNLNIHIRKRLRSSHALT